MGKKFIQYISEASNSVEKSNKLMDSYETINKQAKVTEERMNELYTMIDGLDSEESRKFSNIYEEFNKLLVEFQDMILTVQQIINKSEENDNSSE